MRLLSPLSREEKIKTLSPYDLTTPIYSPPTHLAYS